MARLDQHLILYDDHCPMCAAYTGAFVQAGLLQAAHRQGMGSAPEALLSRVDPVRGRHEIPLIDLETGRIWYGLAALREVLRARWPWIGRAMELAAVRIPLRGLYWLIAYNRRIMAGAAPEAGVCSAPDRHPAAQWAWIILAAGLSGLIAAARLEAPGAGPWAAAVLALALASLPELRRLEGLGQWASLTVSGAVLWAALLALLHPWEGAGAVAGAASLSWMFREWVRRFGQRLHFSSEGASGTGGFRAAGARSE
jgi:predicted DCC family thiol-disulfide oxidoreductase YuxK